MDTAENILAAIRDKRAKEALKENPLMEDDPWKMKLSSENLKKQIRISFDQREETEALKVLLQKMVDRIGLKDAYRGYTWIDEMKAEAYKLVMKEWQRYEDSKQPYTDIVDVIRHSFSMFLERKKKEQIAMKEGKVVAKTASQIKEEHEHEEAMMILNEIRKRKKVSGPNIKPDVQQIPDLPPMSAVSHSHTHCFPNGTHTHAMPSYAGYKTEDVVNWSAERLDSLGKRISVLEEELQALKGNTLPTEPATGAVFVYDGSGWVPMQPCTTEPKSSPESDYDRAMGVIDNG